MNAVPDTLIMKGEWGADNFGPNVERCQEEEMNKYSTEEKQQAIDLYFKNGCNMKKTVRELGYGSATGILRWLRETVPDKVSKPVQRNWKVDYPEEIKQAAVIDLEKHWQCHLARCSRKRSICN